MDAAHEHFGGVWHINCHSMPAVGDALADDPGRERADFVLGDRDGTTCEPALTQRVAETVRAMGYSVAINDPYKGVEIVRRHGRPDEHRHSLQIEIKRGPRAACGNARSVRARAVVTSAAVLSALTLAVWFLPLLIR